MRIVPEADTPPPVPPTPNPQVVHQPQREPIDPTAVLPGGNPFAQDAETLAYQRLNAAILQMDVETDRIQNEADMQAFAARYGLDQEVMVHFAGERLDMFLARAAGDDGQLKVTKEVLTNLMGAMWLDAYTAAAVERSLS